MNMSEKMKKFLFRVVVAGAGAAASYLTSTDLFGFAWKMLAWTVAQAVLPLLTELPVGTAARKVRFGTVRKYLSRV